MTGYLDRLVARASGASPSRLRPRRPGGYNPGGPYEAPAAYSDEPAVRANEPIGLRVEPVARDNHAGGRRVKPAGRQDEPVARDDHAGGRRVEPAGLRDEPVAGDDPPGVRRVERAGLRDEPTAPRGDPVDRYPLIQSRRDEYDAADPRREPATPETGGVSALDAFGDPPPRPSFVGRTTSAGTGDSSSVETVLLPAAEPAAEPAAGAAVESWGHDGPESEASLSALGFGSERDQSSRTSSADLALGMRPAAPALVPGHVGKRGPPVVSTPGAAPGPAAAGGEESSGPSAATRVHDPSGHADQQPALDRQTPKPRAPADPAPGSRAGVPRPRVATAKLSARYGPTESASPSPDPEAPDRLPAQAKDYVPSGWRGQYAESGRRPERPGERHQDQEAASGEYESAITVVDVTIGRIEIRPAGAQRPEPKRREQAEPPLSLHDYLEKRR